MWVTITSVYIIVLDVGYHHYCIYYSIRCGLPSNGFRSFAYAAPFLWNHLPNTVRSAPTYLSFRKSLKTYFFNQAFPT